MGWDKDSTANKAKAVCASRAKPGIQLYFSIGRQMSSLTQENRNHHAVLFGMTNADISNVPPTPSLPQLLFLSTMPCGMGHPYGQSGSAVLSVFPPNYLWSSSPLWQGSTSSRKVLGSVQHCSATTITSVCCHHYFDQKSKMSWHEPLLSKLTLSLPSHDMVN